MIKLGLLGSTRGTHLLTIADAIQQKQLDAVIKVVISNKPDALILERARSYHLPAVYMSPQGLSREVYDHQVSAVLKQHGVDLVVLIGYMRILSADFIADWPNKIINIHPSLLPAFAGKMDLDVHQAVLEAGVSETGCTVHRVTEKVDAGPIVIQKKCPVKSTDNPASLKERVQQLEGAALLEAIRILNHQL